MNIFSVSLKDHCVRDNPIPWCGCKAQIPVLFHLQQKHTRKKRHQEPPLATPSAAPWLPVASVWDLNLSLPGGADGPGHPQWATSHSGLGFGGHAWADPPRFVAESALGLYDSLRGGLLQPLKKTAGCPRSPLTAITRQRGPNPEALPDAAGDTGLLPEGGSVLLDVAGRGLGWAKAPDAWSTSPLPGMFWHNRILEV